MCHELRIQNSHNIYPSNMVCLRYVIVNACIKVIANNNNNNNNNNNRQCAKTHQRV